MNLIDPKTVTLLTGVMSGLMAIVLYALKRNYPPSVQGLGRWSLTLTVLFFGGVLVSARGVLPDLFSISLSNLLLWIGLYLGYTGTQQFFGITPRMRNWLILIALLSVVQLWFNLAQPDYRARLALTTTMTALLTGVHAWLVLRQGSFTFARVMTICVLAAMATIQLLRLATVSSLPVGSEFLSSEPIQLIYVATFAFVLLLFSVSVVLLATERLHDELQYQATHDSLTQALTRRRMNEACAVELERCHRHGRSMAMLLIDLDHFKTVNDTWGHQVGDRVLVRFVADVNALLRQPDLLGRQGGEEFLVLLPETSLDEALAVAERIRETCERKGQEPGCTASIGVTTNHKDTDTVDSLLARADAAMYRAKAHGRNRVESA
jgi:diguanylate cyclase (GGDEF)-like protein